MEICLVATLQVQKMSLKNYSLYYILYFVNTVYHVIMCILFILERYIIVLLWKYVFWPAQMVGVLYIYNGEILHVC